jgi:hypothetical protein
MLLIINRKTRDSEVIPQTKDSLTWKKKRRYGHKW